MRFLVRIVAVIMFLLAGAASCEKTVTSPPQIVESVDTIFVHDTTVVHDTTIVRDTVFAAPTYTPPVPTAWTPKFRKCDSNGSACIPIESMDTVQAGNIYFVLFDWVGIDFLIARLSWKSAQGNCTAQDFSGFCYLWGLNGIATYPHDPNKKIGEAGFMIRFVPGEYDFKFWLQERPGDWLRVEDMTFRIVVPGPPSGLRAPSLSVIER